MLSLRLMTIAQMVKRGSKVLDVGTDHAYLPIYLRESGICKEVIASDISPKALASAKQNIEKFETTGIKLVLSDGLDKIDEVYDTLVISGMGTNTIIHILENKKLPNKIILSSNNNLPMLREYLNNIGYKISEEVVVCDKNKYYDIISYEKGQEKLSKKELLYGKSQNKKYFQYLYENEKRIFKDLNLKNKIKKLFKLIELKMMSI